MSFALKTNQQTLAKRLDIASRLVGRQNLIADLQNILLCARDGRAYIAASNAGVSLVMQLPGTTSGEGEAAASGKLLSGYIGLMPQNSEVSIAESNSALKVSTSDDTATLRLGAYEVLLGRYEEVMRVSQGAVEKRHLITLPGETLERGITQALVSFSPQTHGVQWSHGVLFRFAHAQFSIAASDGFRLSLWTAPAPDVGAACDLLIQGEDLKDIARLVRDSNQVQLATNPYLNRLYISGDGFDAVVTTMDVRYPDISSLIARTYKNTTRVAHADLLKACRRAALFAESNLNQVSFSIYTNGTMYVSATSPESGENVSRLKCAHEGSDITIAFNVGYVLDALGALSDSGEVVIQTSEPNTQSSFSSPDGASKHIIMPMAPRY